MLYQIRLKSDYLGTPIGVTLSTAVIPSLLSGQALSAAKDLRSAPREILRCAQDDRWRPAIYTPASMITVQADFILIGGDLGLPLLSLTRIEPENESNLLMHTEGCDG